MTSQCRTCHRNMSDDNKTLLGKPFKACARCRKLYNTYHQAYRLATSEIYSTGLKQMTQEQEDSYKIYQLKYRKLMKHQGKTNINIKEINDDDFIINFS